MAENQLYSIPELKNKISDQDILIAFYENKKTHYQSLIQNQPYVDSYQKLVWNHMHNKAITNIKEAKKVKSNYESKINLLKELSKNIIN